MKKRQSRVSWSEVVRVESALFLVNSSHRACRYETIDGRPLAEGYYLALCPPGADATAYGSNVQYLGPFANAATAKMLHTSALGLGIVSQPSESQSQPSQPVFKPYAKYRPPLTLTHGLIGETGLLQVGLP